ncbi:MAG: PAS domain S-box protein [Deltaproteobacteria bacterium]|nr:PAS domain S-box protein [Deltaproteobacteria bacterium]
MMEELRREYAGLLAAHLEHPGESHLFKAYALGKECAEKGITASEVINTHFSILESGEVPLADEKVIDSQEFLLEATLATAVSNPSPVEADLPEKVLAALYNEAVLRFKELSKVKEQLRVSEDKYRALYDEAFAMLFSIDERETIIICNNTTARTLGYEKNALIGRPISAILSAECLKKFLNQGVTSIQKNEEAECLLLRQDGQQIRALVQVKAEFFADGRSAHVDFTCRDITESRRAEEERVRLATAIEQAAEGIVITDRKGTIEYSNPAFAHVCGYSRAEIIGQNLRVLKSDAHDAVFYKDMWQTIFRGDTWTGRIINRTKDGALCEFETTISPIRDGSGGVTNFISVNRDVTHEVRLERQLRQAQKMEAIGTLAGGIAHDFNNILTAIMGYTEMALLGTPAKSLVRRDLDQVIKAGYRATELVRQILAFSRQSEQARQPVEVAPIVKEALKLLRASLPTTIDIRQHTAISETGGVVLADPTQIHQVLMNLCTNAADAMRDQGGVLEVSLVETAVNFDAAEDYPDLKEGRYLRLTVSDTGHGMDHQAMERIFDPFYTTKAPGKGTGMGLAVVHGIVKSHGGTITVASEPEQGTTFHVLLPEIECEAAPELEASPKPVTGSGRILFVDDEELLVDLGQEVLESLGYEVVGKSSSTEALEAFRAQPDRFDLVITDMTMPRLTGSQLAQELMTIRPNIPIILCTGYSELIDGKQAKEAGIREFVMKPYAAGNLAKTIYRVLEEK